MFFIRIDYTLLAASRLRASVEDERNSEVPTLDRKEDVMHRHHERGGDVAI